MVRVNRLKISGFKSFGDEAEVVFPPGVTAVVGPNGCGKSNIGDAINWVLGEQSPRMLRGASMQDVIFNGSEVRKPQGMAEVSLVFSGVNGAPDGSTHEVVLTRRLFRDGESEYLVNGARSRLKDIQEMLRDFRIGAQTYATIEQGRIEQILNAKPKERRLIIEEAAGISGFKHKRRLAELKLDATHANLLRVNDIVAEVRRQINSLKRQAARARRYQRLRDELRRLETARFANRARDLDSDIRSRREEETAARQGEAGAAGRLAALEAELEQQRGALDAAEQRLRDLAAALHHCEMGIERQESVLRVSRERIAEAQATRVRLSDEAAGLEARRGRDREDLQLQTKALADERLELSQVSARMEERQACLDESQKLRSSQKEMVETLRSCVFVAMSEAAERRNEARSVSEALERNEQQRRRLESEHERAAVDLERLAGEAAALETEAAQARAEVERLNAELAAGEMAQREARARFVNESETLAVAREQVKSAAASLETLEDVATRFAGVSDGVKLLLTKGAESGIRVEGVVADYVAASREAEGSAEGFLQGLLPAVVLADAGDALRAADLLRSEGAGRTLLLCQSQPAGRPAVGAAAGSPFPEDLLADSRVRGRLRDRLQVGSRGNGWILSRLGDAVLVEGLDDALSLHRSRPEVDYVTAAGDVVFASGLVATGGANSLDKGLLAHNRRTLEARKALSDAEHRAAEVDTRVEAERREVERHEAIVSRARGEIEDARHRVVEVGARVQRQIEEHERTGRRAGVIRDESSELIEEGARIGEAVREANRVAAEAEEACRSSEARLREEVERLEAMDRAVVEASEAAAVLRAELVVRRQRVVSREKDLERSEQAASELEARLDALRAEIEAWILRAGEAEQTLEQTESDLVSHLAERERLASEVREAERSIAGSRLDLQEREHAVKLSRGRLEELKEQVRVAEMARAACEADRRHLDDLCFQELGMTAAEAVASAQQEAEPPDAATLGESIADVKGKIDAIGPVNLTAIQEFAELEERYTFLTSQQKDLQDSMESLRETIRRINRSTRERFTEAFEAIRAHFQGVFAGLFNGGRADLRLEEDADVLECGVEIVVQPPGKRLGNVHLLSGGEKSMAAIALLFAIFRFQPSPFCLLDEVDAALDDVNVNRFSRLLREYASQTQFILITHNKRSMESADVLYGVTMDEPGVSRLMSLQL